MTKQLFGHISYDLKNNRGKWILLFALTVFYYAALALSYMRALADRRDFFFGDFSPVKAAAALLFIAVAYVMTNNFARKPSVFLFNLFFYMTFIPLSVVYACCSFDSGFYIPVALLTVAGAAVCGMDRKRSGERVEMIPQVSHLAVAAGVLLLGTVIAVFLYKAGLPTLTALNLKNVYQLRFSNDYGTSKYFGYILRWTEATIIPFLLAVTLTRKNTTGTVLLLAAGILIFMYEGSKTVLFSLPMTLAVYLFMQLKNANYIFYLAYTLGMSGLSAIGAFRYNFIYSLFVRRTLMIPAFLKFEYYRFFQDHPLLGFGGTLWGKAFGQSIPYERGLGHEISTYFFNNDAMNANTGFLAEGYYRFGIFGLILVMVLFVLILRCIDRLAGRTSFVFALTMCAYPIYTLNDGMLIDSLIFGPFTVLMLIVLFYSCPVAKENGNEGKIALQLR